MPDRRDFMVSSLASMATWSLSKTVHADTVSAGKLSIAPFRFDVTPPKGHSCCGGWIKPVEVVDDALEAIGFVVFGIGKPIVLCAVDWTGLLNDAHIQWRSALAKGAGTTPDRVAVQCVHQHNAPFACLEAQRIVGQYDLPHIVDLDFFASCIERGEAAVRKACKSPQPVTHIAHGQGRVEKVASNRRIHRDDDGNIIRMRGSSCRDEALRAMTEGTIDPWLKTIAFYNGRKKVLACHYYATHPMSFYADGRVTSDFAGLARKRRQRDEPECEHIYFTGCAGNIAAGKYNDGSKEARVELTERTYQGLVQSEERLSPIPIAECAWKTTTLVPEPRKSLNAEAIAAQIADPDNAVVNRNRPSYMLSWLRRVERRVPIILSALHINDASMLHLPSECFVQYQLGAQKQSPDRFVAVAAYGDGGPWYIPIESEYPHGGYEVSVAFCEPTIENAIKGGVAQIMG